MGFKLCLSRSKSAEALRNHTLRNVHTRECVRLCDARDESYLPPAMGVMRLAPEAGMKLIFSNSLSASSRNPATEANHCEVARKIVGFFVRQSYGYLCP